MGKASLPTVHVYHLALAPILVSALFVHLHWTWNSLAECIFMILVHGGHSRHKCFKQHDRCHMFVLCQRKVLQTLLNKPFIFLQAIYWMKHARDISNFSLGEIGKYSLQYKNIHTKFLFCFAFASKAKINSSSGFGHFEYKPLGK